MALTSTQNQQNPILSIKSDVQCKKTKNIDKNPKNLNNFFEILRSYQQWSQIFKNNEMKNILLQHKVYNYKIPLKSNIQPIFEPIWFLFEKKFGII